MITDGTMTLSLAAGDSLSNLGGSTQYSGNSFEFSAIRELGEGRGVYVVFNFPKAVFGAGGSSLTISFDVISTTNGIQDNIVELGSSGPIPIGTSAATTNIKAGTYAVLIQPSSQAGALVNGTTQRRYLSARYVIGGTGNTTTDGAMVVHVDVALDIQSLHRYYASGFTVV